MTDAQLRLPGIEPPRQIRPASARRRPAVWVRRLRILRELAADHGSILRDVELRRGLNIVWAPPHEAGAENALFRSGVSGHTAGKSTLCRFVRHVLGERSFAPEAIRRTIRQKLPSAWVVAEVVVDDVTWVVARPLGLGPRPFCFRDSTLEHVAEATARLEYGEFLQALTATTIDRLTAVRFPTSDDLVRWEHVLPWLSRDQECRFADFLDWRHSSSESEAPALTIDERQFVVRSVLGLISDDERIEQQTNAKLIVQRKQAVEREPLLRHQAETDHARLSKALGIKLPLPSMPLFGSEARAEIERRLDTLLEQEKVLAAADRRNTLRTELEEAVAREASLKSRLAEASSRLQLEAEALGELSGKDQSGLLATLPPPRDFCNVPMSMASEHGCPLATSRPHELRARRSERAALEELATRRKIVSALEREVNEMQEAVRSSESATQNARRAFLLEWTRHDETRGRILQQRAALSGLAQLVDDAEDAANEAAEQADSVKDLSRKIEDSYTRQEELRRTQHAALWNFSAAFDYIVRAILGNEVTGVVDTVGRSLRLTIEEHGERESAAIATVKLLAFDLAALVTSIEGHGAFPRFLIHDGPREADMARDIYERLFLFVHELERCFGTEPSFQYILTTTTRPPDHFVALPWLRLKLAGMPAEERLLKCDL